MGSPEAGSAGPGSDTDEFAVRVERVGQALVLAVAGEVDMLSADALEQRISEACAEAPPVLVIDLAEVGFLGSLGIAALLSVHNRAPDGTAVRIVADGPATAGVLRMMGVDRSLSMFPTRAQALEVG